MIKLRNDEIWNAFAAILSYFDEEKVLGEKLMFKYYRKNFVIRTLMFIKMNQGSSYTQEKFKCKCF